ncbi:MAG: 2-methylisocitrate lyase, partial [Chitinophagaceae bacterium]
METKPTPIITASNPKKNRLANIILFVVLLPLLAAQIYFGYQLHTISKEQEQLKEDYSTFNSISFGVFSIDLWREKIADIVNDKIQDFKIAPEQKADLRKAIEKELHATIN